MNTQDAYQWNQLILAAIDGTISEEDFARLDRAIRTDPKVANHYVQFMLLYAGLRQPGQVSTFFSDPQDKSDLGLDMELWKELADFEKTAETIERALPSRIETTVTPAAAPLNRVEHKISRMAIYTSIISIAALLMMVAFVFLNPRIQEPVGTLVKTVDAG